MSVYSGFATRQQETLYDKLTCKLLVLLSGKIIRQEIGGKNNYYSKIDERNVGKWFSGVKKIFRMLKILEQNKHLEPKLTEYLGDLMEYFTEELVVS